jgi:single-stranded DNA-binding protein
MAWAIQTGSYDKDGKKVYTWEVVAEKVQWLTSKNSNTTSGVNELADTLRENGFDTDTERVDNGDIPF